MKIWTRVARDMRVKARAYWSTGHEGWIYGTVARRGPRGRRIEGGGGGPEKQKWYLVQVTLLLLRKGRGGWWGWIGIGRGVWGLRVFVFELWFEEYAQPISIEPVLKVGYEMEKSVPDLTL